MIRVCKQDKESVIAQVRQGKLDAASLSTSNLVDDIILSMHQHGILDCISDNIPDKRADNTTIPFSLVWALAIAAKMKVRTSLTDIPFAITDGRALAELGYNFIDTSDGVYGGLMREGSLRFLIGKYEPADILGAYNRVLQRAIVTRPDLQPTIHILDCTKLEVNLNNENYQMATIGRDKDGRVTRGYKLATIRGICKDSGIIEAAMLQPIHYHDIRVSEPLLKNLHSLKPGDILINDKGFLSREMINFMKNVRGVDTYVPIKKGMDAFNFAISTAHRIGKWERHPYRPKQRIAFVGGLGGHWQSDHPRDDVEINACVVHDDTFNKDFVFVTTDLTKSARDIIKTYELRPEIEEDYRQLKDFWKLEDFKSTKLNVILFHIVCVLFGYLFFQLYTMLPEGEKYSGKSLPVILKNYNSQTLAYIILYVGAFFGIFSLLEVMQIYAESGDAVRLKIGDVIGKL